MCAVFAKLDGNPMVQCLNGRQVSALLALPPLAALLDALDAESPDKVRDKRGSLFHVWID